MITRPCSSLPRSGVFLPLDASAVAVTVHLAARSTTVQSPPGVGIPRTRAGPVVRPGRGPGGSAPRLFPRKGALAGHPGVREREVMRRDLARDAHSVSLRAPHERDPAGR